MKKTDKALSGLWTVFLMLSLFAVSSVSLCSSACAKDSAFAAPDEYRTQIETGHTKTRVRADRRCISEYREYCDYAIGYVADLFEHNYIAYIVRNLDKEDFFSLRDSHTPVQDVDISIRVNRAISVATIIMEISQHYVDTSISYTKIVNYLTDRKMSVEFSDIFADPELAAIICAQKIYDTFEPYESDMLPLVKSQIEINPENFLLLKDGVEFDLTKNNLAPPQVKAKVKISLAELAEAKPLKKWFPMADPKLTFEAEKSSSEDK